MMASPNPGVVYCEFSNLRIACSVYTVFWVGLIQVIVQTVLVASSDVYFMLKLVCVGVCLYLLQSGLI